MADDPKVPDLKPANAPHATKALSPTSASPANNRKGIQCQCGMMRLLPRDMVEGSECTLVPCPNCGWTPRLRHLGDCMELLDSEPAAEYEGEVPVVPLHTRGTH